MSPVPHRDASRATPSPTVPASGPSSAPTKSPHAPEGQMINTVVRSKRTPIACTECRRRQVKCSGGSPQCERCEKRGVKCEYIPCSQQKASSSSPSTSPSAPESLHFLPQPMSPYLHGHSPRRSPTSWQQPTAAYEYFPETPNTYEEQRHWQAQGYGLSPSAVQVPQQFFGGAPAQARAARPAYSGEDYNQPTYSYHTYGQGSSVQPTIPSHQGYSAGTFPNGYVAPDAHVGAADPSLSYGYGGGHGGHGRATLQAHLPSQRATYSGQYHQGGNPGYSAAAGGTAPDYTNPAWTPDMTYLHGAPYP